MQGFLWSSNYSFMHLMQEYTLKN